MKKIILYLLLSISLFAAELDSGIFLIDNFDTFFYSKGENFLEIKDKELTQYQNTVGKYKEFYGLNITEVLQENRYMISFYTKRKKLNFIITAKITEEKYKEGSFYQNEKFENDFLNGISTYYIIGEDQFVYYYLDGILFISNDIANFFDTTDNITELRKETLGNIDVFNRVFNKAKNEKYLFYKNYDNPIIVDGKKINHIVKSSDKIFYGMINYKESKFNDRNFDFSKMLIDEYDEIYLGKNINKLLEVIAEDFEMFKSNIFEEALDTNKETGEYLLELRRGKEKYFVLKTQKSQETFNNLIDYYEKSFFYERKLEINRNNDILSFEIPYLGIKNFYIVEPKTFIFSKNQNIIEELSNNSSVNDDLKNIPYGYKLYYNKKDEILERFLIEDGIIIKPR